MPITSTPNVPTVTYGQNDGRGVDIKSKWWTAPSEEMHAHVWAHIKRVRTNQKYRSINYLRYARLYSNMELGSMTGIRFDRTNNDSFGQGNRVTYNVVKACIDTAASKVARNKPRPFFLGENLSWDMQRRCQDLTRFFQGYFERMGTGTGEDRSLWGIGRQTFVDGCLFGTGATKYYTDGNDVKAERVFIDELLIDDAEGRYRQPRQMHQVKLIPREVAFDLFRGPENQKILEATPSGLADSEQAISTADMIEVAESWHLPSGDDVDDGRHCYSVENGTLHVKQYKKDYFPFTFQRWSLNPLGFYGRGLADELVGIQLEINKHLRTIQLAQHLMAVPQVWMDVTAKVPGKKINNEVGGIRYYRGTPPIFMVPQAMGPEVYQHLENLYMKAFEITGVSQMAATSRKPDGLDSGKAIREYKDIQSERFALVEDAYTDTYMEATFIVRDMLRDIVAEGGNPVVRSKDGNYSKQIKFKDVDIPNDNVSVRPYPTNFLPSTPAGKFQTAQEMVQAGFFTQEEALALLDFPDIAKLSRIKLSGRDAVLKTIEYNINNAGKDYISPDPRMNLDFAAEMTQQYIMIGMADGMAEEQLDVLRAFQDQIEGLKEQAMMAMQQQQAAMMPPPAAAAPMQQAVPEAPPVSDLIPQGVA